MACAMVARVGRSGQETGSRRSLALRPELKVLVMSGYMDHAVLRHGVIAPGSALLQKPFALEDLLERVRSLLDTG
jgi:DNA-binding NarL/FixJ family response regulator